ncbi:MAG: hypothetical protein HYR85_18755 [Planctomycetes bacterium]|nr:hypothetical protein [Planctomycetota bacterium]MBI3847371.1 hypothetical protein [Planctomycetota bacterium]
MSWFGFFLNLALVAGLAFGVYSWWKWRQAVRARRFRLDPVSSPPGPWVRATRWLFESLIVLEVLLAIAHLGGGVSSFADVVSGGATNRLLVAVDLVFFVFLLRSDVVSSAALLCDDAIRMGWGIAARYGEVESVEWLGADLLVVRTHSARLAFSVRERERESVARFIGEKTGKVVAVRSDRS